MILTSFASFGKLLAMENDVIFMQEALQEAKKAYERGEVPVGAVLVYEGRVIARAHNQIEEHKDASRHAELLCLQEGARILENWRLKDTTLYSTLEPCCMCAGAMLLARISTLVWGARDIRHGAHGSWVDILGKTHPTHSIEVRSGVLQEEASELMRAFFRKRREENASSI